MPREKKILFGVLFKRMKRLNPKTGKPFKAGDIREDGYVFCSYTFQVQQSGFYREQWTKPEKFKRRQHLAMLRFRKNKALEIKADPKIHKKSINPETGKHWVKGEMNSNNQFFNRYSLYLNPETNLYKEVWFPCEESYKKDYIRNSLVRVRKRCKERNLPYDLDNNYLLRIYPQDGMCPALEIPMVFGGGNTKENYYNSPSIDRIIPAKGYVKGNVRWLSRFANTILGNANADQILKVGKWLKAQGDFERNTLSEE